VFLDHLEDVARLLGPSGNGEYALAFALFVALATLSTFGIELGITWLVSANRWSPKSAFLFSQKASLVLGLIGAAVGLAAYELIPGHALGDLAGVRILPVLAAVPFSVAATFSSRVALATERYEASVAIPGIQAVILVVSVSVLTAVFGLEGALVGLLVSQVGSAIGGFVLGLSPAQSREKPADSALRVGMRMMREAAAFGYKPYLANVLGLVIYRFDLFLLRATSSSAEVGLYAVAVALTNAVWLFPSALSTVLFPRISALSASADTDAREEVENRSFRHTTILLLAAGGLLALALPLVLTPLYGSRFGPALVPALLLIPGAIGLGFATIFYSALAGRGHPEYALTTGLIVAPLSVGLYFLLIPPYGATGGAIASSISYCGSAVLAAYYIRRVTGQPVFRRLVPDSSQFRDYRALLSRIRMV